MDGERFDRLVISLATGASRRAVLKSMALSLVGISAASGVKSATAQTSCTVDANCGSCEYCDSFFGGVCRTCTAAGVACRSGVCTLVACTSEANCAAGEICCVDGSCTLAECCGRGDCDPCESCNVTVSGRTCGSGCGPQECCNDVCQDCCIDGHCPSCPGCGREVCSNGTCSCAPDDSECGSSNCQSCSTATLTCQSDLVAGQVCCDDQPFTGDCCITNNCGACEQCVNHVCTSDCDGATPNCCGILGAGNVCRECCNDGHCASNPNGSVCLIDNTCGGCTEDADCGSGQTCCGGVCGTGSCCSGHQDCDNANCFICSGPAGSSRCVDQCAGALQCCNAGNATLAYCGFCCSDAECATGECCALEIAGTCSAANCETGCTPMTCAVDFQGECGDLLPDGCGGTISCSCGANQVCCDDNCCAAGAPCCLNSCCAAGQVCGIGAAPVCCTPMTCAVDYAGQCGDLFSDGCGGTINCGCGANESCCDGECCANTCCDGNCCLAGQVCDETSCCTPDTCAEDHPGLCGVFEGSCGVATLDCPCDAGENCCDNVCCSNTCCSANCCAAGQVCDLTNACCTPTTCASSYPNQCGQFSNGCGGFVECGCGSNDCCAGNCCATSQSCCGGTVCCDPGETCCLGGGDDDDDDDPIGLECCAAGTVCFESACCTPRTCAATELTGMCGEYPDHCGGTINCSCSNGGVCCDIPDDPDDDDNERTCCAPGQVCSDQACCTPSTCPVGATGVACGSLPNDCGGTKSCGCEAGLTCCNGFCRECCDNDDCDGIGCAEGNCVGFECEYTDDGSCEDCQQCDIDGSVGICNELCDQGEACCLNVCCDLGQVCCDDVCSECCEDSDCTEAPCGVCNPAAACDYGCMEGQCCGEDNTCSADACDETCKSDKDCEKETCCCKDGTCSPDCCEDVPGCKSDKECDKESCCCNDGSCSARCCASDSCINDGDCAKGSCCCSDETCDNSCCDDTELPSTGTGPGKDDPSWLSSAGLIGGAAAVIGAKLLRDRETQSE